MCFFCVFLKAETCWLFQKPQLFQNHTLFQSLHVFEGFQREMGLTNAFNLILTAEELQLQRNFRSVIILCGFAGLILLIVAGKLFYDRVIGPKLDELEAGEPKKKKKAKKNAKQNRNQGLNQDSDSDRDAMQDTKQEPDTFEFQYESIEDEADNAGNEALEDEEIEAITPKKADGNSAANKNATGNNAAGNSAANKNAIGNNAAGNSAAGEDTTRENTSKR